MHRFNLSRYAPFGRVRSAVSTVQGGTAEGVVQVFAGTYDETASNGGAVILSNPCKLQSADGSVSVLR
ncbi:MAG: hypothetical protein JSR77_11135 [Planctomycetes bacterium]|nr:hypothetical protein [Planctomycetota bacterium]